MENPNSSSRISKYSVAMIFAMEFEMSAFRYMLDEEHTNNLHKTRKDQNEYILGRVGSHNVVLAWLPGEQGIGAAAVAATNLDRTFPSIEWRFLVGIGGGIPSRNHDIRLGDVVVGVPRKQYSGVAQYDLGRETPGGFQRKGFLHAPPAYLRSVANKMQSNHLGNAHKIDRFVSELLAKTPSLRRRYQRPDTATDVLFRDGASHRSGLGQVVTRKQRASNALVKIHYGLIASGNSVLVDEDTLQDRLKRLGADVESEVLCVEMEAAGVMSGYPCLVIRGISDYADSHKDGRWLHYAAATAAACAKELLLLVRPTSGGAHMDQGEQSIASGRGDEWDNYGEGESSQYYVGQGAMVTGPGDANIGDQTFYNYRE